MKKTYPYLFLFIGAAIILWLSGIFHSRIDITSDKKHTLSDYTKDLLKKSNDNIKVTIYLDGALDSDFLRLKKETRDLLDEFNRHSSKKISYFFYDPNHASDDKIRQDRRSKLLSRGMKDEILTETDDDGRMIQRSVFPWADIILHNDTVSVHLLSDDTGQSIRERINKSTEDLEYQFADALTELTQTEFPEIAFLEGHGELPEVYVYDAVEELGRHYTVFRGIISDDIEEIPPYKALIIAGSNQKFTEREKYLLDDYITSGGSILFLISGAIVSYEELRKNGQSPSMVNDINLDDLFFKYGFRINPVLIQDLQCAYIPLKIGENNTDFHPAPWYFAPLLNPSGNHPITKNSAPVKAEFVSSIDLIGTNENISKQILLSSSGRAHVVPVPEMISPDAPQVKETAEYFNKKNIPAAVLLEGQFPSAFENRLPPEGINRQSKKGTKAGKIVVAGSGNIIRNELRWSENEGTALPLGYDSYMDKQFGNKDFIVNAVNYLAGNEEQMMSRNKQRTLRLLDKTKINSEKHFWQYLNIGFPIFVLLILMIGFQYGRKRKYGK